MSEVGRIEDELRRSFGGEAYHGPALGELLAEVSAEQAAARPIPRAHTIWEIVLHLNAWHRVIRQRLEGERIGDLPPSEDWPAVSDTGTAAWRAAGRELGSEHLRLREAILRISDRRLADEVPERSFSFYTMLHGSIQHDLYHAGQIALLKKVVGKAVQRLPQEAPTKKEVH